MVTEKFIGYIVKKSLGIFLHFDPAASCELPVIKTHLPLVLYIHIPFCEELCTYCSFHRVMFQEGLARDYFAALRKEVLLYKRAGYDFRALYIGGGTPTVLIDELAATIELIKSCFSVREISVETNPNHLDPEKMKILKAAGVQRLSVGVQSFDDDVLKATERYYKYGSGEQIIGKIQEIQGYFNTLNVDMMFNFPLQTEAMLHKDLAVLRQLQVDQITYYPLMVATKTREEIESKLGIVDDDRGRSYYEIITTALKDEYRTSTAWCFSREESLIDEYVINYEEYVGLGSGAFGYINGAVYANLFDIPAYIEKVEQGKCPIAARRDCNLPMRIFYDFMMQFFGLSIDFKYLRKKYGLVAAGVLWPIILFFLLIGGIKKGGNKGSYVAKDPYYGVIMMREFFTAVNNIRDYCRSNANQSLDSKKYRKQPIDAGKACPAPGNVA